MKSMLFSLQEYYIETGLQPQDVYEPHSTRELWTYKKNLLLVANVIFPAF